MPLKLMYITNRPDVAKIAEENGVDRIFVDMEYIGKAERQGKMDTVQNHHTIEDVRKVRAVLNKAELLVRLNPIHNATEEYCSSEDEINAVIDAGADIVMLPYFKTIEEIHRFITAVNGRVKTMLLLETKEAVAITDVILTMKGIDEIHIGLNDLCISYGKQDGARRQVLRLWRNRLPGPRHGSRRDDHQGTLSPWKPHGDPEQIFL